MKSSAIAHSNIALIKYWGRSSELNIPMNDSISMTKQGLGDIELKAHTTIFFSKDYVKDVAFLNKKSLVDRNKERVLAVVNPLREMAGINHKFMMASTNDFPTQSGLASSAAGFAALAIATSDALGLKLSKDDVSKYARLGSGSAARSVHGGFVHWHQGVDHETSYAEQLCGPTDFQMNAVIALVSDEPKTTTSDSGHTLAATSPLNNAQIKKSQEHVVELKKAILDDDFKTVGSIAEENCKLMHAVMETSKPPLYYRNQDTFKIMKKVEKARSRGLECYYTIDAGPNVHVLTRPENVEEVEKMLKGKTIRVKPAGDSGTTEEHLF
ncbi:MAG: diphosphomevalonate decarboxylase [Candidatus Undinarchaeales archaeon]|nr:diphosphomevalonate decarboxylase [Candidatus Undinarchaeales archaeon]